MKPKAFSRDTPVMKSAFNRTTNPELLPLLHEAEKLARSAGAKLLKYYGKNDAELGIELKDDNSPATVADRVLSDFLVHHLTRLTPGITVVSEENDDEPSSLTYWAVDPLDGTREFLDRTKGFCVKIALIQNARPVLGVVFCPAQDVLYTGVEHGPALKTARNGKTEIIRTRDVRIGGSLTTLFNLKHADANEYKAQREALREQGVILPARPRIRPGLPRSLLVAEGLADVHMVSGGTPGTDLAGSGYVWDNAPDHLILQNAGGGMMNLCDGRDPAYDTPRERMPAYIAYGDPFLRTKLFPAPENR